MRPLYIFICSDLVCADTSNVCLTVAKILISRALHRVHIHNDTHVSVVCVCGQDITSDRSTICLLYVRADKSSSNLRVCGPRYRPLCHADLLVMQKPLVQ